MTANSIEAKMPLTSNSLPLLSEKELLTKLNTETVTVRYVE
jgi:hypothetical protein